MLSRLVELQRQHCAALANRGETWYDKKQACNVPEGWLVVSMDDYKLLVEGLHFSPFGWDAVEFYMTTDDTCEYLVMSESCPSVECPFDPDDLIIALRPFVPVLPTDGNAKAATEVPKAASIPKPARKIEFL